MPIFHECQRCTACCRWPGQVRLSETEITRIASFLQRGEHEFIQQYTHLSADRRGLILADQPSGACIFLHGDECRIQPVKPQQCRDFPNLWNFPGFTDTCKAIPRLLDVQEYRRRIYAATGRVEYDDRDLNQGS